MSQFPIPQTKITVGGKPLADYLAEQDGSADRQLITELGDDLVTRIVAHGHTVAWEGATYAAGATVRLPAARANELTRSGVVSRPEDFHETPARPVTIRETGQAGGARVLGPDYYVPGGQ